MMFKRVKEIILATTPTKKIELFRAFYDDYKSGKLEIEDDKEIDRFNAPSFASFCKIVEPRDVKKRSFSSKLGRAIMVHALAHIEYSAIDLALDHAYRFRGLPKSYYDDWLEVADEEIEHFLMLEGLLADLGYKYRDFEVHQALFEAMQKSQTLLERMAIVPRFLEANGLDSNDVLVKRIEQYKDSFAKEMLKALNIILEDEISHVKKGDMWFKYACNIQKLPTTIYFEILKKHYPNSIIRNKKLNIEARLKAGFDLKELEYLGQKQK